MAEDARKLRDWILENAGLEAQSMPIAIRILWLMDRERWEAYEREHILSTWEEGNPKSLLFTSCFWSDATHSSRLCDTWCHRGITVPPSVRSGEGFCVKKKEKKGLQILFWGEKKAMAEDTRKLRDWILENAGLEAQSMPIAIRILWLMDRERWEAYERCPQPGRGKPECPQPKWEEPECPQPKSWKSVHPQPKRGKLRSGRWDGYLHLVEASSWCPSCGKGGHYIVNCPCPRRGGGGMTEEQLGSIPQRT
ncbi:UNVERIFIED_CONTAM: hypothetical protein FKN15_073120 [Acipenser sinensis]